jgi:hypothetical protein
METRHTQRISRILTDARERGEIPWEWIVDETREAERPGTWADPESFADAAMRSFRRDRWQYQPVRIEVWSEKGTVRGTLAPILHRYGLTFRVFHGFSSASTIREVAVECRDQDRPTIALYVGDYDPSGLCMSKLDLPRRLREYGADESVDLFRAALLEMDCQRLPSQDLRTKKGTKEKKGDPRYKWFVEETGQDQKFWELDAMNPNDLRDRVEHYVLQYIDAAAWERTGLCERAEQDSLREILGQWPGSIPRQVSG